MPRSPFQTAPWGWIRRYDETATGHSTQVGAAVDDQGIYGQFEYTDGSVHGVPDLDACGGHYGYTPDSPTVQVYVGIRIRFNRLCALLPGARCWRVRALQARSGGAAGCVSMSLQ